MNLNSRYKQITLIISDKNNLLKDKKDVLASLLDELSDYYVWIKHDKDINENGELKLLHYHFVIILKKVENHVPRGATIINKFSEGLGISEFAITINKVVDMISNVRYLLHLDQEEKHLYKREELITNDEDITDGYLSSISETLSVDYLFNLVRNSDGNLYYIMSNIGVERYRKLRLVILDIIKSQHLNVKIVKGK